MDRNTLIGLGLIGVILALFTFFNQPSEDVLKERMAQQEQLAKENKEAAEKTESKSTKKTEMKHLPKSPKTKLCGLIILLVFSASGVGAQDFHYAPHVAIAKFTISTGSPGVKLFPENYDNGYEIGGLVFYNPKPTPFHFYTGLSFTRLNYEYYDLSYGSIPLGLNFQIGNKAGVFLGPGIKLWLLLNDPDKSYDFNRVMYSLTAQLGVFFTVKSLKVQLYPQIEFVQTPLYQDASGRYPRDYNLFMTSYNLTVSF